MIKSPLFRIGLIATTFAFAAAASAAPSRLAGPGGSSTGGGINRPAQSGSAGSGASSEAGQPTTAQRIVARAVREMAGTTGRTCEDLRRIGRGTIGNVRRLDQQGADNDAITAAGQTGKDRVDQRAAAGTERIATVKANALTALGNNGGTQEQIDAVNSAAARFTQRIADAAENSKDRIDAAVAQATGG
jgi:hypothetical protein